MNIRVRAILYGMMIALLALASAFSVIPARADDGAPPPAAPAGGNPATVASSPGTAVVVVNDSGHKVPLASQEAARIIAAGDPVWCPVGVAPGGTTCSPSGNTSFQDLLDWLGNHKPAKAGVIWIEYDYDNTAGNDNGIPNFTLDGSSSGGLGNMGNYTLTINGGWSGTGTTLWDPLTPSVFNGASLDISSWKNAVTLNNLTIENAGSGGLSVATTGSIVLNNINAITNTGTGVYLDNTSGTAGTVTVNDSTFNNNIGSNGLEVHSKRAISVNNITANYNGSDGVFLNNNYATSAQPVTISGVNNFNHNGAEGLKLFSKGAVTLSEVTATYNSGLWGVDLDNTGGSAQPVTTSGIINISFNGGGGLYVLTRGAITLGNMMVIHNAGGDGAWLDNCNYNPTTEFCGFPGIHAVTMKGSSEFSNNGLDGLEVWASGAIAIKNLTANDNGTAMTGAFHANGSNELGMGAYLDNYGSPTFSAITLSGTNSFIGNGANGLYMNSFGLVTVNNLNANGNGLNILCQNTCDGAYLYNGIFFALTGTNSFNGNGAAGLWMYPWLLATVNNITANGNGLNSNFFFDRDGMYVSGAGYLTLTGYGIFNGNYDAGLHTYTWGTMTLANLSADGNGGRGVDLFNYYGSTTLTGANVFTNNQYTGLYINGYGAITLNNITASHNGLAGFADDDYGVLADNCMFYPGSKCTVTSPQPVTLNGINVFDNNYSDGLRVISLGAITVRQVTSTDNGGDGAYLDNCTFDLSLIPPNCANKGGPKNITLTGTHVFNNNSAIGLEVYSNGNIVMSNLTANGNVGATAGPALAYNAGGAFLYNVSNTKASVAITLTGFNSFSNNGTTTNGTGLYALSDGAITISNLTASNNGYYGANLNDENTAPHHALLAHNITLTGINIFNGNAGDGLNFTSSGAFSATIVTASKNTAGNGILGTGGSTITLTCGNMYLNGLAGLNLTNPTARAITLRGVYSGMDRMNGSADVFSHPAAITRACSLP